MATRSVQCRKCGRLINQEWATQNLYLCGVCYGEQTRQDARSGPSVVKTPLDTTSNLARPPAPNKAPVTSTDATMRSALARLATKIEDAGLFERFGGAFWDEGELMLGLRNSEWLAIHKLASMIRQIAME